MKTVTITLAIIGLALAGCAGGGVRQVSDLDYARADHCKGLAAGLGAIDPARFDPYLEAQDSNRLPAAEAWADAEFAHAKRAARYEEVKPRLASELSGACSAYLGHAEMAAR